MTKEKQKQWKEEASQLKKDMKNRPKVVKKREVEIKFGAKAKKNISSHTKHKQKTGNKTEDLLLRQQLGL